MYLCKIIAEVPDDFEYLRSYVGKYPIKLLSSIDNNDKDNNVPVMIVGWSTVKKNYPTQNILNKNIEKKTQWVFSKTEGDFDYNSLIEEFVNDSIKKWLPNNFVLFDPLFQKKTINEFAEEFLDLTKWSYLYFNDYVLYLNNNENNFVVNIKSLKFLSDDWRSLVTEFINNLKCMCFSYKNIAPYVDLNTLNNVYTFEGARWIQHGVEIGDNYFSIVPGFDTKKYTPFIMSKFPIPVFSEDERKSFKRLCEKDNITQWLSERTINLSKDFKSDGVKIQHKHDNRLVKVSYSNKRTITGRITANDSYNPQNLNKETVDRSYIISRFKGGKIVVFDYISFEARIALYFCEDIDFIEKFKFKDIHIHTAGIIFGNVLIDEAKRAFAKDINHRVLYGSSKDAVINQLSSFNNPEEIYYNIQVFLKPLLIKFNEFLNLFNEVGYIKNPWGTIVRPNKNYASYNNFMQSSAAEIVVDQLYKIKSFLHSYKSQFLFQVHDSLVFDICPEESWIVRDLAKILMCYKDMYFSISYSRGDNYKDLTTPIEIIHYSC